MATWQKVFSRRNWKNRPSTATPLNETNLNVGDAALDAIDDRVIELNNRTNELEGYETAAAQSAASAAQSESNSEAWAVGQRDGTDVSSTDETYHNNAKYYAGQASTSAQSAASAASTAAQDAASQVETTLEGYVDDASDYADLSQNWAVGTPTGIRNDEATNNSKYYSQQSQTYMNDSHGWADNKGDSGSSAYSATNNSYYYSQQSKSYSQTAETYAGDAEDAIDTIRDLLIGTTFSVNFTTGNLEYTGVAYDFAINTTTGNLMWEVA